MDVDDDDDDHASADGEGDEDEASDAEDVKPLKSKKKSKVKKGRKSELNLEALQNEAVAVAALQGEQLQQVRLKRKYYAECLNFIRQIEGGMKIIEELLASNSKAEVLEAMDFFRVIHDYKFDGADVSVLHLHIMSVCRKRIL